MTQYRVHTVRCPNCSRWFNFTRLAMYSTFAGASTTIYTDFFNEAAPLNSALLGCSHCSTTYWSKDLPISSTYGLGEFRGKSPSASPIYGAKLVELLEQRFWKTQEEEFFLRVMAWWWLNMPYRKAEEGKSTAAEIDERLHENLSGLPKLRLHGRSRRPRGKRGGLGCQTHRSHRLVKRRERDRGHWQVAP